jgi:hypothetical protein
MPVKETEAELRLLISTLYAGSLILTAGLCEHHYDTGGDIVVLMGALYHRSPALPLRARPASLQTTAKGKEGEPEAVHLHSTPGARNHVSCFRYRLPR